MTDRAKHLKETIERHLKYSLAKDKYSATKRDKFEAVQLAVRDFLVEGWIITQQNYYDQNVRRCYYLSLEFLMGKLLKSYLLNLGLYDAAREAVGELGMNLEQVFNQEWDAGLGHGGLGRLAACYIDSMATLRLPVYGYGIRYEFGIFFQRIEDGWQVETPDNWLRYGTLWEFPRPEIIYSVQFGGDVKVTHLSSAKFRMHWENTDKVMAMAYDYPILGYRNGVVNTLRLWSAKATREFNLDYFNNGDYLKAMADKSASETVSKVLYPSDQSPQGKDLRLKQQYFFVSATLQDIMRRYCKSHRDFNAFPEKVTIQLNDTHPAIAIPELMRIFVDEQGMEWDDAWPIVARTFNYTNHTVLPEALETWSVARLGTLLPRHLQIIQEIDRRFLVQVGQRFPGEPHLGQAMRIIPEDAERRVHMARLCIIGSQKVNGVSGLHSDILKQRVFPHHHRMWPQKFTNITNGITPRRWLLQANHPLSALVTEAIGDGWTADLEQLRGIEPLADDAAFRERFQSVKLENKHALAYCMKERLAMAMDPMTLLDCQAKRFHEYKRQLLNVLHCITLYNRLREGRTDPAAFVPRTVLFAGKSAPSYHISKLVIKLIHNLAEIVEADPDVSPHLKIFFLPNYGVSSAEQIIPAADLSEQISTAGFEASGTGNMKFALNGALTIGTLDGANVEIREAVGPENFFLFGLSAEQIPPLRAQYDPRRAYETNPELKQAIDQLSSGWFSPEHKDLFWPLVRTLIENGDYFLVLADYDSYIRCQEEVARAYQDRDAWTRKAILNVARCGRFSSDRSIKQYAEEIWGLGAVE